MNKRRGNTPGVAQQLARLVKAFVAGDLPVRLVAWDGSEAGPPGAPTLRLNSPQVLRRQFWHPGELGAAQSFVLRDIDTDPSDSATLREGLARGWAAVPDWRPWAEDPWAKAVALARLLPLLGASGALVGPPRAPRSQVRLIGRLHSPRRDRAVVRGHYDLSNAFFERLLGPTMAYSCAYWTTPATASGLDNAQRRKLDLIVGRLALAPGNTLLDVGCGWGSLVLHAARRGVRVTGVTLSASQAEYVAARIAAEDLGHLATVRQQDYREILAIDAFDAVASIEMGEHVGERNYPRYAATLAAAVRPGGRVLVQQMSRHGSGGRRHPGGGPFIEAFITADMHMPELSSTLRHLEIAGLETSLVENLREHYARTVDAWTQRFDAHQAELTELVGEEVVRVWRLYLVGARLAFESGRMGVDQIVLVKATGGHREPS